MNRFTKSRFVGRLSFQGSSDGSAYTTLFTVGSDIHEGWNYINIDTGATPYTYYRFYGSGSGSCNVGEIKLIGVVALGSEEELNSCETKAIIDGTSYDLTSVIVVYSHIKTGVLELISPRHGTVKGGTTVSFTGTSFGTTTTATDVTVTIDDINCPVETASDTEIVCVTGSRPGSGINPTLVINIGGMGDVSTQGKVYRYTSLWSDPDTWGGEFEPMEGESVYVP